MGIAKLAKTRPEFISSSGCTGSTQKTWRVIHGHGSGAAVSSVPKRLADRLWLEVGGFSLGESSGTIIAKHVEARFAKKDLRTGDVGGASSKARYRQA